MSRSRKKVPGYVDRNPWAKNYANRRIRQIEIKLDDEYNLVNEVIPDFSKFKLYSETYDICDYRCCYHSASSLKVYVEMCVKYRWCSRRRKFRDMDHLRDFITHKVYAK